MFTRLLYFDKERVIEYNAIISNEDFVEFDQIEITASAGVQIRTATSNARYRRSSRALAIAA